MIIDSYRAGIGGLPQDPLFDAVVLLAHFDGDDESTTFVDSSNSGHTITAHGDAQLDTAQKKFGTASLLLDGVGDYASIAASADFALTDEITIEGWIRPTDATQNKAIITLFTSNSNRITVGHLNDTLYFFTAVPGNSAIRIQGGTVADATQQHWALTKDDEGVWRLFLDGVLLGTSTTTNFPADAALAVAIGAGAAGDVTFAGHQDEVRITRACRYTAAFAPPSAPFPDL